MTQHDPIEAFERAGTVKRRWMMFGLGAVVGVSIALLIGLIL